MAELFDQHPRDLLRGRTVLDPVGVHIDALGPVVPGCCVSASHAAQFAAAAQLDFDAQPALEQGGCQRVQPRLEGCAVTGRVSERVAQDAVEVVPPRQVGEDPVDPAQGGVERLLRLGAERVVGYGHQVLREALARHCAALGGEVTQRGQHRIGRRTAVFRCVGQIHGQCLHDLRGPCTIEHEPLLEHHRLRTAASQRLAPRSTLTN